jgi:hypothetical protein
MFIAKELGLTIEQALELSDLEFRMWIAYYRLEAKERERSMKHGRRRNSR